MINDRTVLIQRLDRSGVWLDFGTCTDESQVIQLMMEQAKRQNDDRRVRAVDVGSGRLLDLLQ